MQRKQELEENEHYQIILHIRNYIYQNTWTWIGFLGGKHYVCLAKGDWRSSLPESVELQWDYIESYLKNPFRNTPLNELLEIRRIGVEASRQVETPRRHPSTSSYYLVFSQSLAFNNLNLLKSELPIQKSPGKAAKNSL